MTKSTLTLNCDMGESFGPWKMGCDDKVMPWIDMANIACGFHASDPHVMSQTVDLAIRHGVQVGAHPGYPDLQGFGRRSISYPTNELSEMLIYQIGALKALCESKNTEVSYVKPHGALYHDMMKDLAIFEAVVDAVSCFNVPLMILATSDSQAFFDIADKYEVPLLFEAFADRAYLGNGSLCPRSESGAVLTREEDIINQVRQIARYAKVTSKDGFVVPIEADTICVHGDNESSAGLIAKIRQALEE
ncbi:5-oxoprolinase subunit PxpA [Vibrio sp. V39_P1S14PM300]|uniref:5-oxoprolinase subunit PxpA n=1 Tax=Vibrio sp. V39_P1S14PM300 TaxID=1938690 RepID=UPI001372888E|nr:5-oxoprolinase subunit PxpA [Vibrio sp. V39_P1S14PM300]NAX21757.1 5-oxoprolinase subunit PxpA [Vibrio sp. V39_P1S14PM300]